MHAIVLIAAAYHRHALSLSLSLDITLSGVAPALSVRQGGGALPALGARAREASNLEPSSRKISPT